MYYLQSRYYDPAIGRFINADTFATTDATSFLSCNMFAYCQNNPVNREDPRGTWTVGVNIGANLTLFVGASINVGIYFDGHGNIDIQWNYACPGINGSKYVGLIDAGASMAFQYTDRDTVYDLYGPGWSIGVSGGELGYLGFDMLSFADDPLDARAQSNGF